MLRHVSTMLMLNYRVNTDNVSLMLSCQHYATVSIIMLLYNVSTALLVLASYRLHTKTMLFVKCKQIFYIMLKC